MAFVPDGPPTVPTVSTNDEETGIEQVFKMLRREGCMPMPTGTKPGTYIFVGRDEKMYICEVRPAAPPGIKISG